MSAPMKISNVIECAPLGSFYVDTRTAAACYELPIDVPVGVRGVQPVLVLQYRSLQSVPQKSYLSAGWDLSGIPTIEKIGESRYIQDGTELSVNVCEDGTLIHFDSEGAKTEYVPQPGTGQTVFTLFAMTDLYGNTIRVAFDERGRPKTIAYGCRQIQDRRVVFSYDDESGQLIGIVSFLGSREILGYSLFQECGMLGRIQISAKSEGEYFARKPIVFAYDEKSKHLLTSIVNTTGSKIDPCYADERGILAGYQEYVSGPLGKVQETEYTVTAAGETHDQFGTLMFEEIAIWSVGSEKGNFWKYHVVGRQTGLLCLEGTFKKEKAEASDLIIEEIQYDYQWFDLINGFLKTKEVTTSWVTEKDKLPSKIRYFAYDTDGLLIRLEDDKSIAKRQYINGPDEGRAQYLVQSALYDRNGTLLRQEIFDYRFEEGSGAPVSISRRSMIDKDQYSNVETSRLNSKGLIYQQVKVGGTVHTYHYDDFSLPCRETISLPETSEEQIIEKTHAPAFGHLVYEKNPFGAITTTTLDAFGTVIGINTCDLSNPSGWGKATGLVPMHSVDLYQDQHFNTMVRLEKRFQGAQRDPHERYEILDSQMRVVAEITNIDTGKWQVQFFKNSISASESRQSLPFVIHCKKENLAKKVRAIKATKVRWIVQKRDLFGQDSGSVLPDGSHTSITYSVNNDGDFCKQEVAFSPNGIVVDQKIETVKDNGSLHTVLSGDQEETRIEFDMFGQIISKCGPDNQNTTYKWNALGQCVWEENAVTGITKQEFGPDLRISRVTHNERVSKLDYNGFGQLIKKTHNVGREDEADYTFQYALDQENCSQSVTSTHPDGWILTLKHAPNGEIIERQVFFGQADAEIIRNDLHPDGSVRCRHYPDGRSLEFQYEGRGWLSSAKLQGQMAPLVCFEDHDIFGRPHLATFENGIQEIRKTNCYGQVEHFSVHQNKGTSSKTLLSQDFQISAGFPGLVQNVDRKNEDRSLIRKTYDYDRFSRLVAVAQSGSSISKAAEMPTEERSPPGHPIQPEMKFDTAGLMVRAAHINDAWHFEYGSDGRLKTCHRSRSDDGGIASTSFVHDALGDLLIKEDGAGSTTFFVDEDYLLTRLPDDRLLATIKVCSELGTVAELTASYTRGPGLKTLFPMARRSRSDARNDRDETISGGNRDGGETGIRAKFHQKQVGTLYLHLDFQATSVLATKENGHIAARLDFDAFGCLDPQNSVGSIGFDLVYAGMRFDPSSGLYHAGQRFYAASLKQFLSPDPLRSTTDLHAYPVDPINNFDDQGLCPCSNCARAARRNYGRSATIWGTAVMTAISSFGLFFAWDMVLFGYDSELAFRWAISIALWFTQLAVIPGVYASANRNRRIMCCRARRHAIGTDEIGECGTVLIRAGISASVGAVFMGPLLSFIGNSTCGPWTLFQCPSDYYSMNAARGVFASGGSSIISSLMRIGLARCQCNRNSLCMRYCSGLVNLWVGFAAWQALDLVVLKFGYGQDTMTIMAGKLSFATGEIPLSMLMSQPNPFWGMIPVLFSNSCPSWMNRCFSPRAVFDDENHPRHGDLVPFFPGGRAHLEMDEAVQMEVVVDGPSREDDVRPAAERAILIEEIPENSNSDPRDRDLEIGEAPAENDANMSDEADPPDEEEV
jgi:RHS repeat-associated protein